MAEFFNSKYSGAVKQPGKIASTVIPKSLYERIDARAAEIGTSRSLVIRDALEFALDYAEGKTK